MIWQNALSLTDITDATNKLREVYGLAGVSDVYISTFIPGLQANLVVAEDVFVDLDASLGQLSSSAQLNAKRDVKIEGEIGLLGGQVFVEDSRTVTVSGSVGQITSLAEIEVPSSVSIDSPIGSLVGYAEINIPVLVSVNGSVGSLSSQTLLTPDTNIFINSSMTLSGKVDITPDFYESDVKVGGNIGNFDSQINIQSLGLVSVDGSIGIFGSECLVGVPSIVTIGSSIGVLDSECEIIVDPLTATQVSVSGLIGSLDSTALLTVPINVEIGSAIGRLDGQVSLSVEPIVFVDGSIGSISSSVDAFVTGSVSVGGSIGSLDSRVDLVVQVFVSCDSDFALSSQCQASVHPIVSVGGSMALESDILVESDISIITDSTMGDLDGEILITKYVEPVIDTSGNYTYGIKFDRCDVVENDGTGMKFSPVEMVDVYSLVFNALVRSSSGSNVAAWIQTSNDGLNWRDIQESFTERAAIDGQSKFLATGLRRATERYKRLCLSYTNQIELVSVFAAKWITHDPHVTSEWQSVPRVRINYNEDVQRPF